MLLSLCSDNITSVETIHYEKGNELANKVLVKYISSETILYDDLCLIENMIRMHAESKAEYLNFKSDSVVEKIVLTTDKNTQKKLRDQAVIVLELLRDKKVDNGENVDYPVEHDEKYLNDSPSLNYSSYNLENLLPHEIQKFLKAGRILLVYGEDAICRSMHLFLSADMNDIKCKHPKENFVKQKWIIPLHH